MAASRQQIPILQHEAFSFLTGVIEDVIAEQLMREYKAPKTDDSKASDDRQSSGSGGASARKSGRQEDKQEHIKLCATVHTLLPGLRTMISNEQLQDRIYKTGFLRKTIGYLQILEHEYSYCIDQRYLKSEDYQEILKKIHDKDQAVYKALVYYANSTYSPQRGEYRQTLDHLQEMLTKEEYTIFINKHMHRQQRKLHKYECGLENKSIDFQPYLNDFLSLPLLQRQNRILLSAIRIHLSTIIAAEKSIAESLIEEKQSLNRQDFTHNLVFTVCSMLEYHLTSSIFNNRFPFFHFKLIVRIDDKVKWFPQTIYELLNMLSSSNEQAEDKEKKLWQLLQTNACRDDGHSWLYYQFMDLLHQIQMYFPQNASQAIEPVVNLASLYPASTAIR